MTHREGRCVRNDHLQLPGAQTGGVAFPEPHTETLLELGLEPGLPPPILLPLPLGCRELSVAFG